MKYLWNVRALSALLMTASALSACSLKDRQVQYGVSLQLSRETQQRISRNGPGRSAMIDLNGDGVDDGFQCFALNITGPGISAPARFSCTDASRFLGVMGGMAPVSGGQVDVMVPAGANRKIQLLGFESTVGCPSFAEMVAAMEAAGTDSPPGIGEVYLLGETTTDIFGDKSVTIPALFDPTAKYFQGCGHDGGDKKLTFQTINQSPVVEQGRCVQFGLEAHVNQSYLGNPPAVKVVLSNQQGSASPIEFFAPTTQNSTPCTSGVYVPSTGAELAFDVGARFRRFEMRVPPGVTSFDLALASADSTWSYPVTHYTVAQAHLDMTATSPDQVIYPPGQNSSACQTISLSQVTLGGATPDWTPAFNLTVHNSTTNGDTRSSIEVYKTFPDCMNGSSSTAIAGLWSDHVLKYSLDLSSYQQIVVRNSVAERVSLGLSIANNTVQPAQIGINFVPVRANYLIPERVALDGGPQPFEIRFMGDATKIRAIEIGGADCPIDSGSQTAAAVRCDAPSRAIGLQPIRAKVLMPNNTYSWFEVGQSLEYLPFSSGDGVSAPYQVDNFAALQAIAGSAGTGLWFRLGTSLDLSTVPDQGSGAIFQQFEGKLDGPGQSLSGLRYPLFSNCTASAKFADLNLFNVDIHLDSTNLGALCKTSAAEAQHIFVSGMIENLSYSGHSTGALFGSYNGSKVSGVTTEAIVLGTHENTAMASIGGIIGSVNGGLLEYLMGRGPSRVTGPSGSVYASTGGLVGQMFGGEIARSFSRSSMVANGKYVGGIVGRQDGGTVRHSFTGCTITDGKTGTGGIAGFVANSTLTDNLTFGAINGATGHVGGIAGESGGSVTWGPNISASLAILLAGQPAGATAILGYLLNGTIPNDQYQHYLASSLALASTPWHQITSPGLFSNYSGISTPAWRSRELSNQFPALDWTCRVSPTPRTALEQSYAEEADFTGCQ